MDGGPWDGLAADDLSHSVNDSCDSHPPKNPME
jgi:hypothetical protein